MNDSINIKRVFLNRHIVAIFLFLVVFYAVANLVIEPFGKPLEPLVDWIFSGYWAFRAYFAMGGYLIGGFLVSIFFTWFWFFIYAYLLALIIGSVYRIYRGG